MPELQLKGFEKYLLRSGVSPRHVRRTTLEIREHHQDILEGAIADGMSAHDACNFATSSIGDLQIIADAMISRRELRTWTFRYPRVARVCLPIVYVAMLPTAPLYAGIARAPSIARWGACLMLGAAVTATMFLLMQLAISLS